MPTGRHKSRRLRRVFKKSPGGKTNLCYIKRKPGKAKCATCNAVLKGIPREIPSKINKISSSGKKPKRPYGGNLCSKCMRLKMISKTRIGA